MSQDQSGKSPSLLSQSFWAGKNAQVRLGDLLVRAGIIPQEVLTDAMRQAGTNTARVGEILLAMNYIQRKHLDMAIQAQDMIKDGSLDLYNAVRALRLAHRSGISFADALGRAGHTAPSAGGKDINPVSQLGEFLIDAGILSTEQVEKARLKSNSTGLPLGRTLVLSGVLTETFLNAALNAQVLIRDGKVERDVAIKALNIAYKRQLSVDDEEKKKTQKANLKLGDLVICAGIATEFDVRNAVEMGLEQNKNVGTMLVQNGLVSEETLSAAIELQTAARNGTCSPEDAYQELWEVHCAFPVKQETLDALKMSLATKAAPPQVLSDTLQMKAISMEDLQGGLLSEPEPEVGAGGPMASSTVLGNIIMPQDETQQMRAIAMPGQVAQKASHTEEKKMVMADLEEAFAKSMQNVRGGGGMFEQTNTGSQPALNVNTGSQPALDGDADLTATRPPKVFSYATEPSKPKGLTVPSVPEPQAEPEPEKAPEPPPAAPMPAGPVHVPIGQAKGLLRGLDKDTLPPQAPSTPPGPAIGAGGLSEVELLRMQIIEAETEAARKALLEADAKAKAAREAKQVQQEKQIQQAQQEAVAAPVSSKTYEDQLEALVEEGAAVEPQDPEPKKTEIGTEEVDNSQLAFNKFLMLSSVAHEADIKNALALAVRTPLIVATSLSMVGVLDDRCIEAIVRIYEAVRANTLSLDEGVFAISYIMNKITSEQVDPEEAFQKLKEEAAISV